MYLEKLNCMYFTVVLGKFPTLRLKLTHPKHTRRNHALSRVKFSGFFCSLGHEAYT